MSDNKFIDGIKKELDSTLTTTENGALSFKTAGGIGQCLVDFNFAVTQMRNWTPQQIKDFFAKVYFENPDIAYRYWAFCSDVRGGLGERRTSRIIFDWLIENHIDDARKLLILIPMYGRWDSLVRLVDSKLSEDVLSIIDTQLKEDLIECRKNNPFSLLGKWMPSINTSSDATRALARKIAKHLDVTQKQYRQMLYELRFGLKVVEQKASRKHWREIDYNTVPSKANLLYKNAFLKHDEQRRKMYLEKLAKGDKSVKINTATLFPCDIVHKYMSNGSSFSWSIHPSSYDETIEQLWKNLPDYVNGNGNNTLVVADTSGSMTATYGLTNMSAWSVAQSLAIYFSQRSSGPFKDKYIMFSENPFWVDFGNCKSLHDRLSLSSSYNECSNTNLYKTMKLVLDTAVNNGLKQNEIPQTLLIVSDMQFDEGARYDKALMEEISEEFHNHGYVLPKIVFWNVSGGANRSMNVPMQQNENGVILLSGFSASVMSMALSGEVSPFKVIIEKLLVSRYDAVDDVLKK